MKRILIFSTAYHPFIGGAEIAIKEITDRIPDAEFDMITANLDGLQKPEEKIGNITVYRIGKGPLSKFILPWKGLNKAIDLHKAKPYDEIWSMMASQASVAAAMFKKKNPSIPLVLTLQEGDEETHLVRYVFGITFLYNIFIKPWHRMVFEAADKTTAISTYLATRAKEAGSKGEIAVIPNGVDVEKFKTETAQYRARPNHRSMLLQQYGFTETDTVLITTSRLVEKNATSDVVEALSLMPENVKFLIAGVGELQGNLIWQIKNLKLENRVQFAGLIPYLEIPKYLAAADIFIRPSLSEGMGNSFIEAMAAGLPVIATPVGGITDFLFDHETGLLCEVKNPKSIAEKVTELTGNKPLEEKIIYNAQKLVSEKYDWNLVAKRMKTEIFDRV